MNEPLKVDFKYIEMMSALPKARIEFWLNMKRGKKIYSQLFRNYCEASCRDRFPFEKLVYYKLRELLEMLNRQLKTGYLTELNDNWGRLDIKQRKLTKNIWVTAESVN